MIGVNSEARLSDYPELVAAFDNNLDPLNLPVNVPVKYLQQWYDDTRGLDVCIEGESSALDHIENIMNKWAQSTKRFKDDLIDG